MDEETIRKEFEEWAAKESYCLRWLEDLRMYDYANTQEVWNAWIEAARRALDTISRCNPGRVHPMKEE